MKRDYSKYIFTEEIDYGQTPDPSIWGDGDTDTLRVLNKLVQQKAFTGSWLHVAAGDGRYNTMLLTHVTKLIATDIDEEALKKLVRTTPKELASKLTTQTQNITKPFPFDSDTFDGVFNTGTLHLFPESILASVFTEIARVIKDDGLFIFDFATDIKRIKDDGSLVNKSTTIYSHDEAKTVLTKLLEKNNFGYEFISCSCPPEKVTSGDGSYVFSCTYWLIIAKKKY